MGYGSYSYEAHDKITSSRATSSNAEIFQQQGIHPLMNPFGVRVRESRDSAEHPNSVPIVFALDVTGSMGQIPVQLAKQELPKFMKTLLDVGVTDPQVLFMFVGDAAHDKGPLQVGQFESTAEDMDRWLTWAWLEGGGGGNGCESYDMAMYFAARHTETDCASKRQKRGYFFMTGDEKPYPSVSKTFVRGLVGEELKEDVPLDAICKELAGQFHPFFLVPDPGRYKNVGQAWHKVMGDHVIKLACPDDVCYVAAVLVALTEGNLQDMDAVVLRLKEEGLDRNRIGGIVQAITPYAATLGKDRGSAPYLESALS